MLKSFVALAAVAGLALSTSAFAAEATTLETTKSTKSVTEADGTTKAKISAKQEATNASGTTSTSTYKAESKMEPASGDVEKSVTTETTTDPKGLLNKETTKTTDTVKKKNGKTKVKHKKKVNGKTVENTTTEAPAAQ